jgi:hypothetical protein
VGFPIRISPDHRLYTAPRSFSQCPTSFIGTWRQGIHRKPLLAYLCNAESSKLLSFQFNDAFLRTIRLVRFFPVVTPAFASQRTERQRPIPNHLLFAIVSVWWR